MLSIFCFNQSTYTMLQISRIPNPQSVPALAPSPSEIPANPVYTLTYKLVCDNITPWDMRNNHPTQSLHCVHVDGMNRVDLTNESDLQLLTIPGYFHLMYILEMFSIQVTRAFKQI